MRRRGAADPVRSAPEGPAVRSGPADQAVPDRPALVYRLGPAHEDRIAPDRRSDPVVPAHRDAPAVRERPPDPSAPPPRRDLRLPRPDRRDGPAARADQIHRAPSARNHPDRNDSAHPPGRLGPVVPVWCATSRSPDRGAVSEVRWWPRRTDSISTEPVAVRGNPPSRPRLPSPCRSCPDRTTVSAWPASESARRRTGPKPSAEQRFRTHPRRQCPSRPPSSHPSPTSHPPRRPPLPRLRPRRLPWLRRHPRLRRRPRPWNWHQPTRSHRNRCRTCRNRRQPCRNRRRQDGQYRDRKRQPQRTWHRRRRGQQDRRCRNRRQRIRYRPDRLRGHCPRDGSHRGRWRPSRHRPDLGRTGHRWNRRPGHRRLNRPRPDRQRCRNQRQRCRFRRRQDGRHLDRQQQTRLPCHRNEQLKNRQQQTPRRCQRNRQRSMRRNCLPQSSFRSSARSCRFRSQARRPHPYWLPCCRMRHRWRARPPGPLPEFDRRRNPWTIQPVPPHLQVERSRQRSSSPQSPRPPSLPGEWPPSSPHRNPLPPWSFRRARAERPRTPCHSPTCRSRRNHGRRRPARNRLPSRPDRYPPVPEHLSRRSRGSPGSSPTATPSAWSAPHPAADRGRSAGSARRHRRPPHRCRPACSRLGWNRPAGQVSSGGRRWRPAAASGRRSGRTTRYPLLSISCRSSTGGLRRPA
ncbi:hypothetical protein NONO_c72450 [Nocardia nova SH22a]|uniref:Uncharacterized protein n=1 Tax=Nocardia nova SH22a TaxID=1415166 RepID=W5TRV3_9NOCA|nr:hypothetical protein NONO_c72450 [Nocardia nova SH22a]